MYRQYQRFLTDEEVSAVINEASEGDESDPEDDDTFAPRRAPDSESEDCLFLNVFAPAPAPEDEDAEQKPRAVLVWLPGEGLGMADASRYDATLLADRAGIVVVTVNYRVGVLGFLSTGTSAAAGNWGALDVLEALRWVRRNAPAVGGDPARVTLAGRAEGAALASLLLTAPAAGEPPLALRFVLQSGVASAWYHIDADPANATAALASSLGCSGTATKTNEVYSPEESSCIDDKNP
ncbi:carboxylesterase 4A-like [Schistocerca nitens]|uniref:carboxylesterase 4A-like n=1 Tax=Schistocerca nitens TaxID=7011 RepID=UPI0021195817|nr:carboxylesterase 4A-like [Schistocerca nitens]